MSLGLRCNPQPRTVDHRGDNDSESQAAGLAEDAETTANEPEETTTTVAAEQSAGLSDRMFAVSFESGAPSQLWDVTEAGDLLIGSIVELGEGLQLTDVAWFDESTLMAVGFEETYLIDPESAEVEYLGQNGIGGVNALVAGPDGYLYAATTSGDFLTIDPDTGAGTKVGSYGNGFTSSGDLAFGPDGVLYATVEGPSGEALVTVDPQTGAATALPVAMPEDAYGLGWSGDTLYGMVTSVSTACPSGALLEIQPKGEVSEIRCLEFSPSGSTSSVTSQTDSR